MSRAKRIAVSMFVASIVMLSACDLGGKHREESAALLAELRRFRAEAATLSSDVAAQRWFELYDRAVKIGDRGYGDSTYDFAAGGDLGPDSLLASLPPPAAWPALRAEATRRAGADSRDRAVLGMRFLGEVLTRDRAAAERTVSALEEIAIESANTMSARSLLARLYGNAAERVALFERSLHEATDDSRIEVPDLIALAGEERAAALLEKAVATPGALRFETRGATYVLAQRVARANLARLARPQWGLVDFDGADLYEDMNRRFKSVNVDQEGRRHATTYYFLRTVRDGRQADAERALQELGNTQDLAIPHDAAAALQKAGLNEPLFRFLHARLERRPELHAWPLYLEQAAHTGHSREALVLIEKLLVGAKRSPSQILALRIHHADALLAADDVAGAAREYATLLAPPPAKGPALTELVKAAIRASTVGRLVDRPELTDIANRFARAALDLPRGARDFELSFHERRFWAELRRQQRTDEVRAAIEKRLGLALAQQSKLEAGDFSLDLSLMDTHSLLIELASIHLEAGRGRESVKLLDESPLWRESDIAGILRTEDSRNLPFGAIVAQALRANGQDAAALRVARATLAAAPGRDAAYEIVAAIDTDAIRTFDALFALDEFEERPLIWKATRQLAANDVAAAESTIRQAIAIDPSDGEEGPNDRMRAYAVLADILERKGDEKQAAIYTGAVEAIRISERSDSLREAGLYERAFAGYRAALAQFSDAYCIQSRLAIQLGKQGRRAEALEHYRRAYELMPSSFGRVESHCFGCESVFQDADAQSIAERTFSDIIRKSPANAQAHYLLAYLREQQGRYPEALQSLRAAVSLDDRYLNAWKRLQALAGKTHVEPGETDIASLKLLQLDPLQRHGSQELDEIGELTQLWNGAAKAHEMWKNAAPPADGVYPLGAVARRIQAEVADQPPELRAMLADSQRYGSYEAGSQPPASVLHDHALVVTARRLMGIAGPESEVNYFGEE
jgi:tetratricopeptide (TPR) repeat protein